MKSNNEVDQYKYVGKYRGQVINNNDPERRGRVQAIVPDVQGTTPITWAMPCLPTAGKGSGAYVLPEVGAGVWIEFEQGDPEYPIWSGCFWGLSAEMPETALSSSAVAPNIVLQTMGKNCITISGTPGGGIILSCGSPNLETSPRIVIDQTGIVINNGKQAEISLKANKVAINGNALEIM